MRATIVLSTGMDGAISATRVGKTQEGAANGSDVLPPGKDRRSFLRWSVCAAIAVLAHGVIGAPMLRWQTESDPVAPKATVVIELSPVVTAPEVVEIDSPPATNGVQSDSPSDKVVEKDEEQQKAAEDPFEPRPIEPRLEPTPEKAPLQPSEARRQVDVRPVEMRPQATAVVVIEQKSEAELAPPPQPNDGKEIGAPRAAPADERPRQRTVQPKPLKPEPNKRKKQAPDQNASKPQIAEVRQAAVARAPAASTPSNSNALPNWKSQIIGILERNKRSPADPHEHGVSTLAFSLNRQGRVTSARIAASSGSAMLDAETLALVHRAQPFPPPPPEVPGSQIGFVVPISFHQ
jgi:periplasmic protein TonB